MMLHEKKEKLDLRRRTLVNELQMGKAVIKGLYEWRAKEMLKKDKEIAHLKFKLMLMEKLFDELKRSDKELRAVGVTNEPGRVDLVEGANNAEEVDVGLESEREDFFEEANREEEAGEGSMEVDCITDVQKKDVDMPERLNTELNLFEATGAEVDKEEEKIHDVVLIDLAEGNGNHADDDNPRECQLVAEITFSKKRRSARSMKLVKPGNQPKKQHVFEKDDQEMCHQCQWNDKGRVVRCTKCKTRRWSSTSRLRSEGATGEASLREEKKGREKFSVGLTQGEIEEDFMAMVGHKPKWRPKKRAKRVQKQLDTLFPGLGLTEIKADMYKVPETQ